MANASTKNPHSSTTSTTHGLAKTLKKLLAQHHLNEASLARAVDLPQPTIHRLVTGKTEDPRVSTLNLLADYFAINLEQLLGQALLPDEDLEKNGQTMIKPVPIISWEAAVAGLEWFHNNTLSTWNEWTHIDGLASEHAFALYSRASLESRFPRNALLIFDLELKPQDGDFVLLHYPETEEATLRELLIDGPHKQLRSINKTNEIDTLDSNIKLLGVLVETRFQYHQEG